jgi:hypothetical protein
MAGLAFSKRWRLEIEIFLMKWYRGAPSTRELRETAPP